MAKRKKITQPAEFPVPEKKPEIHRPPEEPEEPVIPEFDPDEIPDEDPEEIPPYEIPPPAEGP